MKSFRPTQTVFEVKKRNSKASQEQDKALQAMKIKRMKDDAIIKVRGLKHIHIHNYTHIHMHISINIYII